MTQPPLVSLLLPNKNNGAILGHVLERLATNTTYPRVELIAVDDGSSDDSVAVLAGSRVASWGDDFRILENQGSGAIDALNTALNAASGEFCVQLDSDASVETPGWIEQMLALMTRDSVVGVVTAKVVMDSGALHACGVGVVSADGWCDRPARLAEPAGRRRWHHRLIRPDEGSGGDAEQLVAEVDSGIGCCMMYRREDALAAGGYDQNFSPVWFDDVDLCLSIRRLNRKVFCLPSVRVVHHLSARRPAAGTAPPRGRPRRVAKAITRRVALRLPHSVHAAIESRFDVDLEMHYSAAQRKRLNHHYDYWREKWGWDPRNPDMQSVQQRWRGTEICWATEPERRSRGERIAADHQRTLA